MSVQTASTLPNMTSDTVPISNESMTSCDIGSVNDDNTKGQSINTETKTSSSMLMISSIISSCTICFLYCSWKFVQYRARKRTRLIVQQVYDSKINEDGPLINYPDVSVRERIISTALKRASKWMTLSKQHDMVHPLIGQVGGTGCNKRPILTLVPDYILKPLLYDHRGIREIAFYEAIRIITQSPVPAVQSTYSNFLLGRDPQQQQHHQHSNLKSTTQQHSSSITNGNNQFKLSLSSLISYVIHRSKRIVSRILSIAHKSTEYIDTIAMAISILIQDPYVIQSESILINSWKSMKHEIDTLKQLQKFIPPYYGVLLLSNHDVYMQQQTQEQVQQHYDLPPTSYNDDNKNNNETTVQQQKQPQSPLILPQPTAQQNNSTINTDDVFWMKSNISFQNEQAYLLLQDLTINYIKPCVMDLKMGVQTYEPDALPEKRAREYGKYPQQTQFGFRIVGMRFYDPDHISADSIGFRYFEKSYGRSLILRHQLLDAFRLFFSAGCTTTSTPSAISSDQETSSNRDNLYHSDTIENEKEISNNDDTNNDTRNSTTIMNGSSASPSKRSNPVGVPIETIRRKTISNLLVQLRPLRRWFEENKSLRFYASSLLIVYEGDVENSPNPDMVTIKMIDFGRVRREGGGDQGYVTGLSNLKYILSDLLNDDE